MYVSMSYDDNIKNMLNYSYKYNNFIIIRIWIGVIIQHLLLFSGTWYNYICIYTWVYLQLYDYL